MRRNRTELAVLFDMLKTLSTANMQILFYYPSTLARFFSEYPEFCSRIGGQAAPGWWLLKVYNFNFQITFQLTHHIDCVVVFHIEADAQAFRVLLRTLHLQVAWAAVLNPNEHELIDCAVMDFGCHPARLEQIKVLVLHRVQSV